MLVPSHRQPCCKSCCLSVPSRAGRFPVPPIQAVISAGSYLVLRPAAALRLWRRKGRLVVVSQVVRPRACSRVTAAAVKVPCVPVPHSTLTLQQCPRMYADTAPVQAVCVMVLEYHLHGCDRSVVKRWCTCDGVDGAAHGLAGPPGGQLRQHRQRVRRRRRRRRRLQCKGR